MGHLVNPISYRLSKSNYWNSTWNNITKKNYKNFLFEDYNIKKFLLWLNYIIYWNKYNLDFINLNIFKNYKYIELTFNIINQKNNKKKKKNKLYLNNNVNFLNKYKLFNNIKYNKLYLYNNLYYLYKKMYNKYMKKLKFNILNFNFNNFYIKNYFNYEENRLIFKESNILYKKNILYTRKKNYYYFESYKKKKKLILFKNINFNNYLKKNLNEKFINFFLKKFIKFFFYKIFFIKNILINFYFKKFTGFSNGLKNLILMRLKSKYRISHYINLLYKTLLNNNFSIIGLKIGYFGRYKKKLRNKKIWCINGSVSPSNINSPVSYINFITILKNGICGIKLSILKKKKKNEIF